MAPQAIQVADYPWLVATGTGIMLEVRRSLALGTDDPRYLPVASYIEDHALVLYETETKTIQFGGVELETEVNRYTTASVRNILMADLDS